MRAGSRHSFTNQSEIEQKRAELSELSRRRAAATEVLRQLLDAIEQFKRCCGQTLSCRLAELERIERDISDFSIKLEIQPPACGSTCSAENSRDSAPRLYDTKSTYRRIAKAVHPDIAGVPLGALDRNEMMLRANRAYAADDLRTLRALLATCREAGLAEEDDDAAEIARLQGLIARERQALEDVNARVDLLKQGCAWRLKVLFDARTSGGDVMVRMADMSVAAALRRLALLKGEKGRRLGFPADLSCGTLFVRDRTSANYSLWKVFAEAKGEVEVGQEKAVRLDINGEVALKIRGLEHLQGDDLHSLYLYGTADADLGGLLHLTGLEELYLSGERVTDAALLRVASLTNLKRLYIYQTGITDQGLERLYHLPALCGVTSCGNEVTDQGLALLRRAVPRVKTVNLQWRR